MRPPVRELWSLVAELEAARRAGRVTLLAAVEQVYPAEQAVEAALAAEPALAAEDFTDAQWVCQMAQERARRRLARLDREQDLASWETQNIFPDGVAQALSALVTQTPLAALQLYGHPHDSALL